MTNEIGHEMQIGPSQKPVIDDQEEGEIIRNHESRGSDFKSSHGFYQTNTIGRGSLNMKSKSDLISVGSNNNKNIRKGYAAQNSFKVDTN